MQTIRIVWQRLLSLQGQTCDRCAATELALQQAVATLQQVVAPLQMQVEFHAQAMTLEQFNQDPGASNRIWVADKPLILACRQGVRSLKATYFLMHKGYSNVTNMKFGIERWVVKGFPIQGDPGALATMPSSGCCG